jgi:hypothetical protein
MRRKLLEFFSLARYVRIPDHGGELGGDLESAKHSVFAGREEQWPQPAPPGCGLSTSATPNAFGVVSPEDVLEALVQDAF